MFEALRDSIYSEVATLISQNENRPHFLIELFRELQLLSSDYLRQRALYAIHDLVTRQLTEDDVQAASAAQKQKQQQQQKQQVTTKVQHQQQQQQQQTQNQVRHRAKLHSMF